MNTPKFLLTVLLVGIQFLFQASAFTQCGKVSVSKGNLAHTIFNYGPEFYVDFKVRIFEHLNAWTNILHVTKGPTDGDRFPCINMYSSFFEVTSDVNGNGRHVYYYAGAKLDHDYHIIVSQQYNDQNQLIFDIFIDGQKVHSVENTDPDTYSTAYVYLTDPWHASVKDIGEVSDVTVVSGHVDEYDSESQPCGSANSEDNMTMTALIAKLEELEAKSNATVAKIEYNLERINENEGNIQKNQAKCNATVAKIEYNLERINENEGKIQKNHVAIACDCFPNGSASVFCNDNAKCNCIEGYYGDKCQNKCDCNPEGTGHCNKENGQCVCKVNESNGRTWYGDRCQYC